MNDSTTTALRAAKLVGVSANANGYSNSIGSINAKRIVATQNGYAKASIGSLATEQITPTQAALITAMGKDIAPAQQPVRGADPRWSQAAAISETGEQVADETTVETALNNAMDGSAGTPNTETPPEDHRTHVTDAAEIRQSSTPQSFSAKNKMLLLLAVVMAIAVVLLLKK